MVSCKRSLALIALLLTVSLTGSWAQEAAATSADDYWRGLETEVIALRQRVEEQAQAATAASQHTAAVESKLAAVEKQLHKAEQLLASPKVAGGHAGSAEAAAALQLAEASWLPLWLHRRMDSGAADFRVLLEELKAGNTSRYGKLAMDTYLALQHGANVACARASKELDTHAPGFKAGAAKYCDAARPHLVQAKQLLDTYVLQATWPRQVIETVKHSEGELRAYLTHMLKAHPALAPYADPVAIQMVIYALFLLPLLLVVLPIASVLLSPRRSAAIDTAASKKKQGAKKPAKASKPATGGLTRPASGTGGKNLVK